MIQTHQAGCLADKSCKCFPQIHATLTTTAPAPPVGACPDGGDHQIERVEWMDVSGERFGGYFCVKCNREASDIEAEEPCEHDWKRQLRDVQTDGQFCTKCRLFVPKQPGPNVVLLEEEPVGRETGEPVTRWKVPTSGFVILDGTPEIDVVAAKDYDRIAAALADALRERDEAQAAQTSVLSAARTEIADLQAKLEEAAGALRDFGHHDYRCPVKNNGPTEPSKESMEKSYTIIRDWYATANSDTASIELDKLREIFALALGQAREQAIEEAAKIAECDVICGCPHVEVVNGVDHMHYEECGQGTRNGIVRDIRALARREKEGKNG